LIQIQKNFIGQKFGTYVGKRMCDSPNTQVNNKYVYIDTFQDNLLNSHNNLKLQI